MLKFKKVLFSFLGIYLFVALSLVYADNPGLDGGPLKKGYGQHIQEIYRQLDLTENQKKQLAMNKQQLRSEMQSVREAMKSNKEALRAELMRPQLDMPKIQFIHNQIKVLESQMEDEKLNSILAVRTILTPEQFLKFANLMHKHRQGHDD